MPLLTALFIVPFFASLLFFLCPSSANRFTLKRLALVAALFPLILLLSRPHLWIGEEINTVWLSSLSVHFHLKIDALSLVFLYLTALIIPASLLAVRSQRLVLPSAFYGWVLLLQGLLIIFFTAQDLVVFTIFWEAMLLPLYFIISIWGKEQRQVTALKFLTYMFAGSTLMIMAVLSVYFAAAGQLQTEAFNLEKLAEATVSAPYAAWAGALFLLAFAVKTPLFPFHGWLPDTYYQASTPGTILLAGILSKAGIYGLLRIGTGLFPHLIQAWSPLLLGLSITGVLYGGLAAWRQHDFKRLLAYSSFAHVNFVLVGIFIWNKVAQEGAILQAFNHGITIAALFLVAGWLEHRLMSTSMRHFHGLAKFFPYLCWLTLFFALSSVALPGTNNFVGELLILLGLFKQSPWLAAILGLTVILSVMYMLRWMQITYFGPFSSLQPQRADIRITELLTALPFIVLILWIGIYPQPLLDLIQPAAEKMIHLTQGEPQ